jgi:hypothetical protein
VPAFVLHPAPFAATNIFAKKKKIKKLIQTLSFI